MIDLIPRRDRYAGGSPDLESVNGLIQARIDRMISRRELVRRAAGLGISAAVVGVMLHATSDLAFGAPTARAGRRGMLAAMQSSTIPADAPTAPEGSHSRAAH